MEVTVSLRTLGGGPIIPFKNGVIHTTTSFQEAHVWAAYLYS